MACIWGRLNFFLCEFFQCNYHEGQIVEALPAYHRCVEPVEQGPEGIHPCIRTFDRITLIIESLVEIIVPVNIAIPFVLAYVGIYPRLSQACLNPFVLKSASACRKSPSTAIPALSSVAVTTSNRTSIS